MSISSLVPICSIYRMYKDRKKSHKKESADVSKNRFANDSMTPKVFETANQIRFIFSYILVFTAFGTFQKAIQ